jgi:hypothetical protein
MPSYKVKVSYTNPGCEDFVFIQATNSAEASAACSEIRDEIKERLSSLEAKNVYCSKTVASCEVVKRSLKEDMDSMEWLKDYV